MPHVPTPLDVPAPMGAGLVLLAVPILLDMGVPVPTAREVLERAGVSSSLAYDRRDRLLKVLPELVPRPGNPAARPPTAELHATVVRFLLENPVAARRTALSTRYSDRFNRFAIELVHSQPRHGRETIAQALDIPRSNVDGGQFLDTKPETPRPQTSPPDRHPHQATCGPRRPPRKTRPLPLCPLCALW